MFVSEADQQARVDDALVEAIRKRREELGDAFPRIALFVFDCPDTAALESLLDRIPRPVEEWFEEVVIMQGRSASRERPVPQDLLSGQPANLKVHRLPRDAGHGGARKAAFEYALLKRFDHVVMMRGDGLHPPAATGSASGGCSPS